MIIGVILIFIGIFLIMLSVRRNNITGIILLGPIPIIIGNKVSYIVTISIIIILLLLILYTRIPSNSIGY